jgi:hypothetical protein
MPLPEPEPGLVISYSYLWHYERNSGVEEGRKDRPCVILVAVERQPDGDTVVVALPVTHRPPEEAAVAACGHRQRCFSARGGCFVRHRGGGRSADAEGP